MNMACMTIPDEYVYRAAARTGKDGKYHFRTIMPVPYSVSNTATRPAHFICVYPAQGSRIL